MQDLYDLNRFISAQEGVYPRVLEELASGAKRSHWMWFIFPQLAGLGHSATARRYGITCLDEARAYLAHPRSGERLLACTLLVNEVVGRSAREVFGSPDDLKFRSSMTLFAQACPERAAFQDALDKYYGGEPDPRTLDLLAGC